MHHLDICDILLTIQDFLLLVDPQTNCEIIPQTGFFLDKHNYRDYIQKICIRRKLTFGWLEVSIHGSDGDCNLVCFKYLSSLEPSKIVKEIEVKEKDYCLVRVRDAIREILLLDKNTPIEKPKLTGKDTSKNKDSLTNSLLSPDLMAILNEHSSS